MKISDTIHAVFPKPVLHFMTFALIACKQILYCHRDLLQVVFSASQLSWLNSEQAWAVTDEQWEKLGNEQKQALSMALYEGDAMFGHRGQSDCIPIHQS